MKILNKEMAWFIFISISGVVVLCFQNCSPSALLMGSGRPVKADSLSDMILSSEQEIKDTRKVLTIKPANKTANKTDRAVATTPEITDITGSADNKNFKVKLRPKKSVRPKTTN